MSIIGKFLVKNDINAALFAFGCLMLVFAGIPGQFIAAVVIAMVTMVKGYKSGATVLAFVALPAAVYLMKAQISPFDAVFLQCIVVWLLAGLLRKYHSWQFTLEVITALGVACVGVFHMLIADPAQFWMNVMTTLLDQLNASLSGQIDLKDLHQQLLPIAPYMTGMVTFTMSLILFVQLLVARNWATRVSDTVAKAQQAFSAIHMSWVAAVVMLLLGLVAVLMQLSFARDGITVLLLPFMIAGLSYLHYLAQQYRQIVFLLAVIYFGLFIPSLTFKLITVLAAIGYVDSLCHFRKRFAPKSAAIY